MRKIALAALGTASFLLLTGATISPVVVSSCGAGDFVNGISAVGALTCGTPSGSGTVNSGTAGQVGYYATSTTAISGNPNLLISGGALTVGLAGSAAGSVKISGATSGTVTLAVPAVAGTNTLTLPAGTTDFSSTGGTGQYLKQASTGAPITVGTIAVVDVPATTLATGTSASLTAPRQYYVCTGACTVTPPVPAAGYEFCILNDDNVATVITLAALGSSAMYEKTARTSYGTAGTGTAVSAGAAGDKLCIIGRDSTHYLVGSFTGTWTMN